MSICGNQKINQKNQKLPRSAATSARVRAWRPVVCVALLTLAMANAGEPALAVLRVPDPVESLAFSSDGTVLAAAFAGRVQLIHIPPGSSGAGSTGPASSGNASGNAASSTIIGAAPVGPFPVIGNFRGEACALRSPRFSPAGLFYFGRRRDCASGSATDRTTIPVYDIATGGVARRLGPHPVYVTSLGMSADGERLASAADDGQVRVWSVSDGRMLRALRLPRLSDPRRLMQPFAFDPALEVIAVQDWRDYYMLLIDLESGTVLHKTEYPFRAGEQPLFIFAPDGKSYFDGRRIRESRGGQPVSTVEFNFAMIPHRAAFSPDGQYLALVQRSGAGAAGGAGSTVEVYTTGTGNLWGAYTVADRLESVAWHPDSARKLVAAGGYSGRIYLREF